MRDSRCRARRPDPWTVLALGSLASLAPVTLVLQSALGDPARAWRAVWVHFAITTGVAQGAALIAAVMRLRDPAQGSGVRRVAEVVALALPVGAVAHALVAAAVARAVVAPAHGAVYLAAAWVLALVGTAFVRASMAPDVAAALDCAEIDGWLSRWIAKGVAQQTHVRKLAWGYVVAYVTLGPVAVTGMIAPAGHASLESLAGPYVAFADVYVALAVVTIVATLARVYEGLHAEIPAREPARLVPAVVVLGAALCATCVWQAAVGGATQRIGLVSGLARFDAWRRVAVLGAVIGYGAPVVALAHARVRAHPPAVAVAALLVLVGCWLDRFALAARPGLAGVGVVELATAVGFAAMSAFGVIHALRKVVFVLATPAPAPRAHPLGVVAPWLRR